MANYVRTQVLLEKKQKDDLQALASKDGRSFSELVRELLDIQLRRRKYEEMRRAAHTLRHDYMTGGELTALTDLDGEDFIDT